MFCKKGSIADKEYIKEIKTTDSVLLSLFFTECTSIADTYRYSMVSHDHNLSFISDVVPDHNQVVDPTRHVIFGHLTFNKICHLPFFFF